MGRFTVAACSMLEASCSVTTSTQPAQCCGPSSQSWIHQQQPLQMLLSTSAHTVPLLQPHRWDLDVPPTVSASPLQDWLQQHCRKHKSNSTPTPPPLASLTATSVSASIASWVSQMQTALVQQPALQAPQSPGPGDQTSQQGAAIRFPPHSSTTHNARKGCVHRRRPAGSGSNEEAADSETDLVWEQTAGRRRLYRSLEGGGLEVVENQHTYQEAVQGLVQSYLLPQGFPSSVAPEYGSYMGWRAIQYLFGGAMSVFTTQSLLGALGFSTRHAGTASAAINWVVKDGAGRVGRLLFARWGRELDCELKQFRLMGDLLMEAGAALELCTVFAPAAFLPLACTANLSKNLAAVAASSTRAPIYRTFALQNNLADVTAKGESVANLADIVGTAAGIALSKARLPLAPTFCILSAGYLIASRQEVDTVQLPYLNRARLAYSARTFLTTGVTPGITEANKNEPLLPWGQHNQGRVVLGATVEQACAGPAELAAALHQYRDQRYIVTYRPEARKVFILLRDGASSSDCLKAAFCANVFLHIHESRPVFPEAAAVLATAHDPNTLSPPPPRKSGRWFRGGGGGGQTLPAMTSESATISTSTAVIVADSSSGNMTTTTSTTATAYPASAPFINNSGDASSSSRVESAEAEQRKVAQDLRRTRVIVERMFPEFLAQASQQGWRLDQTMLNPKDTRLLKVMQPLD